MKADKILQKSWGVAALAILCCALWGSAFPSIKIGYQLFAIPSDAPGSQILFAGIRFTLAGILTVLFGSLLKRKWIGLRREAVGKVVKLCLLQTALQYFFFYIGLAHTSGVKGSIIVGTNSLISILVASLLFRQEKLTAKTLMGCLIGLCGVIAANLDGSGIGLDMSFTGEGFVLLSVVAYAFSSVLMKIYAKDDDPVMLSGYQFIFGGLLLAAVGLLLGGKISLPQGAAALDGAASFAQSAGAVAAVQTGAAWQALSVLFYLAFLSAAAYTVWGILLKYNPVSKVAVYGFANPVFGVFLSALFLGEAGQAFTLKNVAALGLVCIGILVVNVRSTSV